MPKESEKLINKKSAFGRTLGFTQSAIILAVIIGSYLLTSFKNIDELSWDMVSRYGPQIRDMQSGVLLIEVNGLDPDSNLIEWEKFIDILVKLDAERIVILPFSGRNPNSIKRLNSNPKVIISSEIEPDPYHPGKNRFLTRDTKEGLQPTAVAALGPHEARIKRYQNYYYEVDSSLIPSLETLAAQKMGLSQLFGKSYGIDFNRANQIPLVGINHVLQGGLSRELVKSKIVIIGPSVFRPRDYVSTPISSSDNRIGALQFHGFSLNTLIAGRPIRFLGPYESVLIIIIVYSIFLLLNQQLGFIGSMVSLTLLCGAWSVIFWAFIEITSIVIPGIPIILVLGATTFSVLQSRTRREEQVVARLLEDASLEVASQFNRKGSPSKQDHGSQVLLMLDQLIPVTRAILFELDEKSNRLCPAAFLRCTVEELSEKRRDIRRSPYMYPIAKDFVSDSVNMLSNNVEDEHQFLCPISSKGKLLTLWLVGTTKVSPATQMQFNQLLLSVSRKAAALSERTAFLLSLKRKKHWWYVKTNMQEIAVSKLSGEVKTITQWLTMLRNVVEHLNSPIIVYDLFGSPIFYNKAMQEALREFSLDSVDPNPVVLIARAGDMDLDAAHHVLQQTLMEGHVFEKTIGSFDKMRRLRIWTLSSQEKEQQFSGDNFTKAQGMVIELISLKNNSSAGLQVEVRSVIEDAVDKIACDAAYAHITFVIDSNQDSLWATASVEHFSPAICALLTLLADDAKRPSSVTIQINADDSGEKILLQLTNHGFGIPEESLLEALSGSSYPVSGPLRDLRSLVSKAFGPKGHFQLDSKVGEGYRAEISLNAVRIVPSTLPSTVLYGPLVGVGQSS